MIKPIMTAFYSIMGLILLRVMTVGFGNTCTVSG